MKSPSLRHGLARTIALLAALLSVGALPAAGRAPGETAIVKTASGRVAGSVDPGTGLQRFFGIPYAKPPVGPRRFRPPEAVDPWPGVLRATAFGPASAQLYESPETGTLAEFGEPEKDPPPVGIGSEDSLTLNIWTPGADGKRRPVMVYIHGGAHLYESGRLPTYDGSGLASRGDIVYVNFNYRLGVFGFADVSVLGGKDYDGSANNGLRDQLLALEWVHRNIAAFGGDPENVTVFGESAGSSDLSFILATADPRRLFRRAILQSGIGDSLLRRDVSAEGGRRAARRFFAAAGIRSMDSLLAMSTAEILEANRRAFESLETIEQDSTFSPRVDGVLVRQGPTRLMADGGRKDIDLLVGTTGYEMGLWLEWTPDLDQRPLEQVLRGETFGPLSEDQRQAITALYQRAHGTDTPGQRSIQFLSDCYFVMPAIAFAEAASRHNPNVWMYRFVWEIPGSRMRSAHSVDLPFVFGTMGARVSQYLIGAPGDADERRRREALRDVTQGAWLAFARHGDPNRHASPGLPPWPRYDSRARATMFLDTTSRIIADPGGEKRAWFFAAFYPWIGGAPGRSR